MYSFDLVILSGLFGIACYVIVPRIMTSIEGDPLLIEDLEVRRDELRATLAGFATGDAAVRAIVEKKIIKRFLSVSYLLRQYFRREDLTKMLADATAEFSLDVSSVDPVTREGLINAIETAATLRRPSLPQKRAPVL